MPNEITDTEVETLMTALSLWSGTADVIRPYARDALQQFLDGRATAQPTAHLVRPDKDSVLEHAGYLANAAALFLSFTNDVEQATSKLETSRDGKNLFELAALVEVAQANLSNAKKTLESSLREFRVRRDKTSIEGEK